MKILTTTLVLSSLLFATPVIAGSGHEHGHSHAQAPVNQTAAGKKANQVIASLVKKGKLDTSWLPIQADTVEKKVFNGHPEWVIIYINEAIANIDKQKLYIFLTVNGDYIAANYTGN